MADMNVRIVISALNRASGPIGQVRKDLAGLQGSAGGRGVGSTMLTPFGMSGGTVAAAAAAAGFIKVTSAAADFESQLTAIEKKAGTTAEETKRIGEEALKLATDGKLASSIDEIMGAYERGAAGGIPIGELREFARVSAMAADAFEMSSEDVGNAASGFKVGLGVAMDQMEAYFGLINRLADSGIASEAGIINFLDRAGANMKQFGLSAEQAAAYGATLMNLKMPPEVAARMMNTLTTKLLSPGSKKANEALKDIVGNTKQFNNLLRTDANAALELFLGNVGKLDKFKSAELLTDLLGQGFADEVLRLSKGLEEVRRNLTIADDRDSWVNSLGQGYAKKLDDFWSKWQIFKNKLSASMIDLGNAAMPFANWSLDTVSKFMSDLSQASGVFSSNLNSVDYAAMSADVRALTDAFNELFNTGQESGLLAAVGNLATVVDGVAASSSLVKDNLVKLGVIKGEAKTDQEVQDSKTRARQGVNAATDLIGVKLFSDYVKNLMNAIDVYRRGDPFMNNEGKGDRLPQGSAGRERFGYEAPEAPQPQTTPKTDRVGTAPTPVDADIQAYMTKMGQAEQARMQVEQPILTQADINTGLFAQKLGSMKAQAQAAVAEINGILGGISAGGSGGGTSTGQAKRAQFAPVAP